MKVWVYIEAVAWGLLLLAFSLLLLLFYGLSGAAREPVYSWLFGDGSVGASAVFALCSALSLGNGGIVVVAGATILVLVAQMQRPLGAGQPLWLKLIIIPLAVVNLFFCLLPVALYLRALLEIGRYGTLAVCLGYLVLLPLTVFRRQTKGSPLTAGVLLVGFAAVVSGLGTLELLQPFTVLAFLLFIIGLFVTSLFFRRVN